jgi:hypothetical protein
MKKLSFVLGAAALGLTLIAPADADQWNKKTILTINQPLQIPGEVLQPGKYVVKLADSAANRHIVQVYSADESRVLATILGIPNYRMKPTGSSEFKFWETPKGTPTALRAWFYPGDNFGQEFAYPKQEAAALSAVVNEQVRAISDEEQAALSRTPAAETDTEKPVQTAEGRQPVVPPAPVAAAKPAGVEPTAQSETVRTTLPRTASPFPLIGVAGLLSIGGGFVVRGLRRRLFPNQSGLN